jgi:hypothetical protein
LISSFERNATSYGFLTDCRGIAINKMNKNYLPFAGEEDYGEGKNLCGFNIGCSSGLYFMKLYFAWICIYFVGLSELLSPFRIAIYLFKL